MGNYGYANEKLGTNVLYPGFFSPSWSTSAKLNHELCGSVILELCAHVVVGLLGFGIPAGDPHRSSSQAGVKDARLMTLAMGAKLDGFTIVKEQKSSNGAWEQSLAYLA